MTSSSIPVTVSASSFEQQLDDSSLTSAMKRLWALSAGLIALDGFDFFVIGIALPFLTRDFNLNPMQVGAIAVAAIAGSLVGSLILGPITDKIGRQIMLKTDIALFILATLGTALAWDAISLLVFRFLVGIAIGADYPLSIAYITENMPTRLRGRMVIGALAFQAVGALLGAITGLLVLYGYQTLYPDSALLASSQLASSQLPIESAWRWMLGMGLILAIAVGFLRLGFNLESPRYYIAKGEYALASEAASLLLAKAIVITPQTDSPEREPNLAYGALFFPPYRRSTLLVSIPWFLQDIATYGLGIFTPVIIGLLVKVEDNDFLAKEIASAQGAALADLFLIVGFAIAVVLIDRVGRIKLQMIGFIGMAVGLLILQGGQSQATLVFTGFFVFNLMMNAGPNSTTFLLSGEVFPTAIRASGAGFAAAFAKAGGILGVFALPILQKTWGISILLWLLSLLCALAALLTYRFRVETSGQSLESVSSLPSP